MHASIKRGNHTKVVLPLGWWALCSCTLWSASGFSAAIVILGQNTLKGLLHHCSRSCNM